jgi:TRAP-type mannitol/chloroaromatic compound transport system substrate-binding protein
MSRRRLWWVLAVLTVMLALAPYSAESAAPEKVITWKVQPHVGSAHPITIAFQEIAERVKAMSGGRFVLQVFPGGGVVPAFKEFDGIDAGSIQAGTVPAVLRLNYFANKGIFCQRSGVKDPLGQYAWMVQGDGHELQQKMIDKKGFKVQLLKGVGFLEGPEIWLHSKKPVKSLADLKGMKIRTAGEAGEILARLGPKTVVINSGEVYDAASRGVIDAAENGTPHVNYTLSFQEVFPFVYTGTNRLAFTWGDIGVNKQAWEALPADLKAIFVEVVRATTMSFYTNAVWLDAQAIDKYKKAGNKVEPIPADIDEAFIRESRTFYGEKAAKDPELAEILKSQDEFFAKWEGYTGKW